MLGRRGALLGLLAAPMIVRTPGLLMPVRRVSAPPPDLFAIMRAAQMERLVRPPIVDTNYWYVSLGESVHWVGIGP